MGEPVSLYVEGGVEPQKEMGCPVLGGAKALGQTAPGVCGAAPGMEKPKTAKQNVRPAPEPSQASPHPPWQPQKSEAGGHCARVAGEGCQARPRRQLPAQMVPVC